MTFALKSPQITDPRGELRYVTSEEDYESDRTTLEQLALLMSNVKPPEFKFELICDWDRYNYDSSDPDGEHLSQDPWFSELIALFCGGVSGEEVFILYRITFVRTGELTKSPREKRIHIPPPEAQLDLSDFRNWASEWAVQDVIPLTEYVNNAVQDPAAWKPLPKMMA